METTYRVNLIPIIQNYAKELRQLKEERSDFIKSKAKYISERFKTSEPDAIEEAVEHQTSKKLTEKINVVENKLFVLIESL